MAGRVERASKGRGAPERRGQARAPEGSPWPRVWGPSRASPMDLPIPEGLYPSPTGSCASSGTQITFLPPVAPWSCQPPASALPHSPYLVHRRALSVWSLDVSPSVWQMVQAWGDMYFTSSLATIFPLALSKALLKSK